MRVIGLEPTHLAAPDPKSGVSTNFTTPAVVGQKRNVLERRVQIYKGIFIKQQKIIIFLSLYLFILI